MSVLAELLESLGLSGVSNEDLPGALATALAGLDDETLETTLGSIRAAAAEIDPLTASDEDLDLLDRAASIIDGNGEDGTPLGILGEQNARDAVAEERAERARALAERINPPAPEGETADPPAVESASDPGVPAEVAPVDGSEGVPAIAAAAPARVTRVAARRPASMTPPVTAAGGERPKLSLVASANNPLHAPGTKLDPEQFADSIAEAFRMAEGYHGPAVKVPVATLALGHAADMYGETRTLKGDAEDNYVKVRNVVSQRAITAAGGICAPPQVIYDLPDLLGTTDRPVRDSLARFGADRGQVTILAPITLADVSGATGVSLWSNTTDTTPGGSTKPCLVMTCPAPTTTAIHAITKCLQVGNFRARFFAEQIQEWIDHLDVWHARFAERDMLTTIGAGSKAITTGKELGAAKDILVNLDKAVSQWRNRYRLPDTYRFRYICPRWVRDQMRADIARELPSYTLDERLAVADAQIERWFDVRGINTTWALEGETGQDYATQGVGAMIGFKATVVSYLFPEGTWLWLDAAGFDFGIVRDSTLISTNDYRIFSETFEGVAMYGVESWRITSTICVDGTTSGTIALTPCTTGS